MSDYNSILASIRTTDDAELLADEVEKLLQSTYLGDQGFEDSLKSTVRKRTANEIRGGVAENSDKQGYLTGLLNEIKLMDTLKLSLAFEPSELGIDKIHNFIVQSVGHHILLDITYDPTLMGGAVISYKGQYRDFSLIRFFKLEFEKEREQIVRMLARKAL